MAVRHKLEGPIDRDLQKYMGYKWNYEGSMKKPLRLILAQSESPSISYIEFDPNDNSIQIRLREKSVPAELGTISVNLPSLNLYGEWSGDLISVPGVDIENFARKFNIKLDDSEEKIKEASEEICEILDRLSEKSVIKVLETLYYKYFM